MIVIICGGRSTFLTAEDYAWLDTLVREMAITMVITGGATGADTNAHQWAKKRGLDTAVFEANWQRYGKSAGYKRNKRMLEVALNIAVCDDTLAGVIGFSGGKGTQMMLAMAREAGVEVYEQQKNSI